MVVQAKKTAGVMGGMGPDATVDFMAKVIGLTRAGRDQDHVHMIVDNDPGVPNRQAAIRSGNDDVSDHLTTMALRLEQAGADFLVMVCNTAHSFLGGVEEATRIPFISIIDESVAEVQRVAPRGQTVGLMATDGCVDTGIYQDAISAAGRVALVPEEADRQALMSLINAIKGGHRDTGVQKDMRSIAKRLVDRGADTIIAGCTEIPLVFDGSGFNVPVVSSTDVLAEKTVALATGAEALPAKRSYMKGP